MIHVDRQGNDSVWCKTCFFECEAYKSSFNGASLCTILTKLKGRDDFVAQEYDINSPPESAQGLADMIGCNKDVASGLLQYLENIASEERFDDIGTHESLPSSQETVDSDDSIFDLFEDPFFWKVYQSS